MNIVSQIFGDDRRLAVGNIDALLWENGSWTYDRLFAEINRTSWEFTYRGIGPGERVVFQCSDTPALVAAYFAVLKIGAVAIAVSTRYTADELQYAISDSGARFVVYDFGTERISSIAIRLIGDGVTGIDLAKLREFKGSSESIETVERGAGDEALWVYSSGSTSRPKGIIHTHRDLTRCCHFHTDTLAMGVGDVSFCTSRVSFAYALANGLLVPLMCGTSVFLYPDWVTPEIVRDVVIQKAPTVVFAVPGVYRALLTQFEDGYDPEFSLPVHYVSAGEHLPESIRTRWKAHTGKTIINVYGCSETLFLALAGNAHDTPANSVGKPLPGVETTLFKASEILDDDSTEPGVLRISHPYMFTYYANRLEDTDKRLVGDKFVTGDLYRRDRLGYWYHLGREDELIKVSGQWVYLRDIEAVCRESALAIEAIVVSAADNAGVVRPALFFVPVENLEFATAVEEMREFLESRLPRVKRPQWIRAKRELPRTATGKIRLHILQKEVGGTKRDRT